MRTTLNIPQGKNTQKSLVVTIGPHQVLPWWRDEIQLDTNLCHVDFERITYKNKGSKQITTLDLPFLFLKMLPLVLSARKQYDYIFTFECDHTSFIISFWQTVLFLRKPKHVILQFIMREKTKQLKSRIKYAVMKILFSSVYKVVCSAKAEAEYYTETFGWKKNKTAFIPYHTSSKLFEMPVSDSDHYIFSGGRVFRDYKTLIASIHGKDYKTVIVAEKIEASLNQGLENIIFMQNIPFEQFSDLLAKSSIVVLPLEDRQLSVGQIVLLHAMALGKAVIVTRTVGTVDYIENNKTGILVDPNNPDELGLAIDKLMRDKELRNRLGAAAKQAVCEQYLPHHYTINIRNMIATSN